MDVLTGHVFHDLRHCQQAFDAWRPVYNSQRPHESLQMATPASRYTPSARPFPEHVPPIEYGPADCVRKVQNKGEIYDRGRVFQIGKAFHGYPVALRPSLLDGLMEVYFCQQRITHIDLRAPR